MKIDIPSKGNGKVLTSDAFGNATWRSPVYEAVVQGNFQLDKTITAVGVTGDQE